VVPAFDFIQRIAIVLRKMSLAASTVPSMPNSMIACTKLMASSLRLRL